jgi:hypothetical protein
MVLMGTRVVRERGGREGDKWGRRERRGWWGVFVQEEAGSIPYFKNRVLAYVGMFLGLSRLVSSHRCQNRKIKHFNDKLKQFPPALLAKSAAATAR